MTNKLPRCPYCGVKTSFLKSFVVKNRRISKCEECQKTAIVSLDQSIYKATAIVNLLFLVALLVLSFMNVPLTVLVVLGFLLVSGVFYSFSCINICLEIDKTRLFDFKIKNGPSSENNSNFPDEILDGDSSDLIDIYSD